MHMLQGSAEWDIILLSYRWEKGIKNTGNAHS